MNSVVLKTAKRTLLLLLILIVLALVTLSFGFPQLMATACEKTGWYGLAATYSSLRYKYSGDIADLARCADDGILAESDRKIVKYCDELTAHQGFAAYCEARDKQADVTEKVKVSYKWTIYGNLAVAKYKRDEKTAALGTAINSMQDVTDFPAGNPIAMLAICVVEAEDTVTAHSLSLALANFTPTAEQQRSYDAVKNILNK